MNESGGCDRTPFVCDHFLPKLLPSDYDSVRAMDGVILIHDHPGYLMTINLNDLSTRELDALINQAKQRKSALTKRKPVTAVRSKLADLANAAGYSIAELFGGATSPAVAKKTTRAAKRVSPNKGRKLGKVPAKYRNPANTKETWSGRGKQPRWLAALTKKGKKPEDFLIKK